MWYDTGHRCFGGQYYVLLQGEDFLHKVHKWKYTEYVMSVGTSPSKLIDEFQFGICNCVNEVGKWHKI